MTPDSACLQGFGTPLWWEQNPVGKACAGVWFQSVEHQIIFFFRDASIFNLYITFYYRKYQSREDQATQGNAYIHNWNGAGAAVSLMDSTKQQLRKNMTNKFPFLMANNTLQACLYRLGMSGARFQNCTVQAFCLAWQRRGRRAHVWFALTTLPNTSCNISCRAKFLTSNNGVLPEQSSHSLHTAAVCIPKHSEICYPYLIETAGEFMEAELNFPNW